MKVTPVSTALGAEISGIDLSRPLSDKQMDELQSLQNQYEVLFFHDQDLSPLQQQQLAQQFGELLEYPYVDGYAEAPYVVEIAKLEQDKINFGGLWHSDSCYLLRPPGLVMLYAQELPPLGGDTLFASMTRAYDNLSSGMKAMLHNMTANFSAEQSGGYGVREFRQNKNLDQTPRSATHPVIRRHPDSDKLSLYVNGAHTSNFTGMTTAESAPILAYLYQHQQQPEFSYRFQWRVGSLAMWDNRTTQHNPLNDYHGYRRVMSRTMVVGEVPLGAH